MLIICIIIFSAVTVWQYFDKNNIDRPTYQLCKTVYFLLPAMANQIVNVIFFFIGMKIRRTIKAINCQQALMIEGEDPKKPKTRKHVQQIRMRTASNTNMWIIIISIFIVDTYATLYSATLFFFGDDYCFV